MTGWLIISGFIGMAIAEFAIGMEEEGIWKMRHSLIFFAIAFPGIGLPWHLFLWRRKKFKLSYANHALQRTASGCHASCLRPRSRRASPALSLSLGAVGPS